MKLIIDLPEDIYNEILAYKKGEFVMLTNSQCRKLDDALRNSIPLPEHHGRLIDADALYDSTKLCHTEEDGTACVEWREINDAPTIIEADKGGADGK